METILNFISSVFCLVTTILTWNNIKKSRAIIKCQNAEIDRVKKESNEWSRRFINRCRDFEFEIQENKKLKAEIERLKAYNQNLISANVGMSCDWLDEINKAKSEAIKDALNRAKKRIGDSHFQNYGLAIMEIMDVEKEMVGDGDA